MRVRLPPRAHITNKKPCIECRAFCFIISFLEPLYMLFLPRSLQQDLYLETKYQIDDQVFFYSFDLLP